MSAIQSQFIKWKRKISGQLPRSHVKCCVLWMSVFYGLLDKSRSGVCIWKLTSSQLSHLVLPMVVMLAIDTYIKLPLMVRYGAIWTWDWSTTCLR